MSILVLGGAGYIGSHTVWELIRCGRNVVVIDNFQTGFRQAIHPEATFYEADIRNFSALSSIFDRENIEGVIHFAACSQVGESMSDPLKYYDNNVYGTMILLQVMLQHGVTNLVFSSTAAVYGEPKHLPIVEEDTTCPTNCYGDTKLAMEHMIRWAESAYGLCAVALRYFNACGAHSSAKIGEAHHPESHLIPVILQVANGQREQVKIFGNDYPTRDGTCVRDYIHVSDLADAHIRAIDYLLAGGQSDVFNLGNGTGFTVNEVILIARRVTGHEIPAQLCLRRSGDPAQLVASCEKAQKILGWQPQVPKLESIVESAWKWHQSHPNGFEEPAKA